MDRYYYILIGCVFVFILVLFFCTWVIIKLVFHEFFPRTRINRIVPINTLIRITRERYERESKERYLIELEQYNKVMAELKNKVIVINPDDTISIGTKN